MRLQPGHEIDRYQVIRVLGRGGLATVYAVQHRILGSFHALKVLDDRRPAVTARLLREGQLQSRLDPSVIVPVNDVLTVDDSPALLMPLVRGCSLDVVLKHQRLSEPEVLWVTQQIARGVKNAHDHQVVHRDLKPANIMVEERNGRLWIRVGDFGLGKPVISDITQDGDLLGTLSYCSPEQLEDAASVGPTADVWSLGVLIFELLTGRTPFEASSEDARKRPENHLAMFLRIHRGELDFTDIPIRWHEILRQMLDVDIETRLQSVDDLLHWLDTQPDLVENPMTTGHPVTELVRAEATSLTLDSNPTMELEEDWDEDDISTFKDLRTTDFTIEMSGTTEVAKRPSSKSSSVAHVLSLLAGAPAIIQRTIPQFTVFADGFSLEAAERIIKTDIDQTASLVWMMDILHHCIEMGLMHSDGLGRFSLAPAIRNVSPGVSRDNPEVQQALIRHFAYYREAGRPESLDVVNRRGGIDRHKQLSLDAPNLLLACERAIERRDAETASLCFIAAQLVLRPQTATEGLGDLGERILWLTGLDVEMRIKVMRTLAGVHRLTGDMEAAELRLKEARHLCMQQELPRELASVALGQAVLWREKGNLRTAEKFNLEARSLAVEHDDPNAESAALYDLGVIYTRMGRTDDSEACLRAGLEICRRLGYVMREARMLTSLANLKRMLGDLEHGRALYERALEIYRSFDNKRGEGIVLGNLGNLVRQQGHLSDALDFHLNALRVHSTLHNQRNIGTAHINIGELQLMSGQLDLAEESLSTARVVLKDAWPPASGVAISILSLIASRKAKHQHASQLSERAISRLRAAGFTVELGKALARAASVWDRGGQHARGAEARAEAESILEQLGGNEPDLVALLGRSQP